MRKKIECLAIVFLFLAVTLFPACTVVGQGQEPAEILDIEDVGKNVDRDANYEYLQFNFTLNVTQSGKYKIFANLLFNGELPLGTNFTSSDLEPGVRNMVLNFNSSLIFKNGKDGIFVLDFNIRYENELPFNESSYRTISAYRYRDFDDPENWPITPEKYQPRFEEDEEQERIIIKNDVMTVWFYYGTPEIVWFYTNDNRSMARFHCLYNKIHGYIDDGRGWFTTGRSSYTGAFEDRVGLDEEGPVEGQDKTYGEYVSYSVTYFDIPIIKRDSEIAERLANITITLTLSSGDRPFSIGSQQYTLTGGTMLKVDLDIDFNLPLGVNGVALEQEIWSVSKKGYNHDFRLRDTGNILIERGSEYTSEFHFEELSREPQRIEFEPKYGVPKSPEGIYFWFSRAEVDGASSLAPMSYSYIPEKKHLRLFLAFTTGGTSITNVHADPGVGVNEGNSPSDKKFNPPEGPEPPNFLVTIAGWISAVFLVILPLWMDFRRAKRKLKELEEEYGEEL